MGAALVQRHLKSRAVDLHLVLGDAGEQQSTLGARWPPTGRDVACLPGTARVLKLRSTRHDPPRGNGAGREDGRPPSIHEPPSTNRRGTSQHVNGTIEVDAHTRRPSITPRRVRGGFLRGRLRGDTTIDRSRGRTAQIAGSRRTMLSR